MGKKRRSIDELMSVFVQIIGNKLFDVGRTLDIAWIHLGEPRKQMKMSGEEILIGEFALHLQSSWRIRQGKDIITGRKDIFTTGKRKSSRFLLSDYNSTLFDQRVKKLNDFNKLKQIVVKSINLDNPYVFSIEFSESIFLDIFSETSIESESWRFLDFANNTHYVIYDKIYWKE
jgi:hypothetical protein